MISHLIELRGGMLERTEIGDPMSDADASLQHYASRSRATNTRRAYDAHWRLFAAWCQHRGRPACPATPGMVAAYLAQRAQAGAAVASIEVMVAAIAFAHKAEGHVLDRTHPALSLVLDGIRREHAQLQQQAEPLTGKLLGNLLAGADPAAHERRDAALLALLYVFALRPSEVVVLDWSRQGSGRGWLSIDGNRAELVLLSSKASTAAPEAVAIPCAAIPRALEAVRSWIELASIISGAPLLRPLTKAGSVRAERLHVGSVGGIVKRALLRHFVRSGMSVEAATTEAQRFSGHSGRVGFYVSATEAGVPPQHIAAVARHGGLAMVRRYARRAELLKCAPHLTQGVGV
jgi:integrase